MIRNLKVEDVRIIKTSFWLYTSQSTKLLGTIILIPLITSVHGLDALGVWMSVTAGVSFIHLSDLGMHLPWLNILTERYSKNDVSEFNRQIISGVLLFALLGCAGAFAVIILALIIEVAADVDGSNRLVFFMIFSHFFMFMTKILRSTLRAFDENSKAVKLEAVQDASILLCSASALGFFGLALSTLAALQASIALSFSIITMFLFLRDKRFKNTNYGYEGIKKTFKDLFPLGKKHLLSTSANAIITNGPILVITSVLGSSSAAIAESARTLANIPRQLSSVFQISSLPEFSKMFSLKKYYEFQNLYKKLLSISWIISAISSVVLLVMGGYILQTLTNYQHEYTYLLFAWFAFWCISESVKMLAHEALLATSQFGLVGVIDILGAITVIIVLFVLSIYMDILALPISLFLVNFLMAIPVFSFSLMRIIKSDSFTASVTRFCKHFYLLVSLGIFLLTLVTFHSVR